MSTIMAQKVSVATIEQSQPIDTFFVDLRRRARTESVGIDHSHVVLGRPDYHAYRATGTSPLTIRIGGTHTRIELLDLGYLPQLATTPDGQLRRICRVGEIEGTPAAERNRPDGVCERIAPGEYVTVALTPDGLTGYTRGHRTYRVEIRWWSPRIYSRSGYCPLDGIADIPLIPRDPHCDSIHVDGIEACLLAPGHSGKHMSSWGQW